jgi:hypothetical protein
VRPTVGLGEENAHDTIASNPGGTQTGKECAYPREMLAEQTMRMAGIIKRDAGLGEVKTPDEASAIMIGLWASQEART